MRGMVAFKHFRSLFWSLFWSLLVTKMQALYEREGWLLSNTFGHFSGHFWSHKYRLCMRERVGCFQTLLVHFSDHFWSQKYRLCMRGFFAFKHFWSLFWSLLVTKMQALYERVGLLSPTASAM
jgi:hypothetical protein